MKRLYSILAFVVLLCLAAAPAHADGMDLTFKNTKNMNTFSGAAGSGDKALIFDASDDKWETIEVTDFPYSAGTFTGDVDFDDGDGASPSLTFTDETDETAVFSKVDAGNLTVTTAAGDGLGILTGNLFVGNGTPGETINGEDLYVEGISEFDGTANFDGAVDFDGTITVGTTAINTATLTAMARTDIYICGDATTVNNNTVYYGPSEVVVSSATVGQLTCDTTAAGNVTEATADAPAFPATAFYPLGMACYQPDSGNTITYTLRSAAAGLTPAISVSIADNVLSGTASATATTAVASGATLAVAVASTGDIGTVPFICKVHVAY